MTVVGALAVVGVSLVLLFAFTVVGSLVLQAFGWRVRPNNALFVLPFLGYASTTVLLGWGVLLNAPVLLVAVLGMVAVSLAAVVRSRGRLVACARGLPARSKNALTVRYLWTLSVAAAAAVLAVLPAVSPRGRLGFVESIGPDALGYAVSGQAVVLGRGPGAIASSLAEAIPEVPVSLVLSPLTGAVYDLADMTLQIQAEFLVGASRVGWAGPMGLLLEMFGLSSTWFVQAVLPTTALFITALIGVYGARRVRHFGPRSLVFIVGSVAGSVLLYSWHQGGVGQVWAVPSFLGIVLAVSGAFGRQLAVPLGSLGVAALAATYSDGLAPALALVGILVAGSLMRVAPDGALRRAVMTFAVGMVLYLPALFRVPQTVFARSLDSAQAGWEIPTTLSLPSLLGLMPLLESNDQGPLGIDVAVQRAQTVVMLVIPILVLAGWFLALAWWNRQRLNAWLAASLAALGVLALVFFLTQVLGEQRNYQLVKAAALMAPAFVGGMSFGVDRLSLWPIPHRGEAEPRKATRGTAVAWLFSVVALVLIATSTLQWIVAYRATATYVDGLSGFEYSTQAASVLDNHTFVLPVDSQAAWSLATAGEFAYGNRPQVKSFTRAGPPRELVLAPSTDAITDSIVAGQSAGAAGGVGAAESGEDLVPLEASDDVFLGRSGVENCQIAGVLWAATGRPPIVDCDPAALNPGAFFLGLESSGRSWIATYPCSRTERAFTDLRMLIGVGHVPEPGELVSSGDLDLGLGLTLEPTGRVLLERYGSATPVLVLGRLNSSSSNFLHVEIGGGRVVGTLNGVESSAEWPGPVRCSAWRILGGHNRTGDAPPLVAVVSAVD